MPSSDKLAFVLSSHFTQMEEAKGTCALVPPNPCCPKSPPPQKPCCLQGTPQERGVGMPWPPTHLQPFPGSLLATAGSEHTCMTLFREKVTASLPHACTPCICDPPDIHPSRVVPRSPAHSFSPDVRWQLQTQDMVTFSFLAASILALLSSICTAACHPALGPLSPRLSPLGSRPVRALGGCGPAEAVLQSGVQSVTVSFFSSFS